MRGSICHTKVGDSSGQGGCECITVLRGWDGSEQQNNDGGYPKGTERGEVHRVGRGVAAYNPGLVFFRKEACAMDDTNTNVNNVIIRDGMLGKVGKCCFPEKACNKQLESL